MPCQDDSDENNADDYENNVNEIIEEFVEEDNVDVEIQVQEEGQESEEENKHNASVAVSSITNLQIIRYDEILDDCKSNKSIGKFVTDICNIPDKQEQREIFWNRYKVVVRKQIKV